MKYISIFLVTSLFFISCSSRIHKIAYPTLSDGKYDSEFPYKNCSDELEAITETVKLLNCTAFYESFQFDLDSHITPSSIDANTTDRAVSKVFFENSKSGTATMIYHEADKVALLSCAHVISFPDTILSYFPDQPGFIQSIAIKRRQMNTVVELPGREEAVPLIIDEKLDVVVLGKKLDRIPEQALPVFRYPFGYARSLEWGTFVYVVGYPKGYRMITRGIVSSPNRDRDGAFMVDALFNRGFSGGIILAVRDGVPNFELVGMAKAVAAEVETTLAPEAGTVLDPTIPYEGPSFVKSNRVINYGITYAISTDALLDFFQKNRSTLENEGYFLSFDRAEK